MMTGRWPHELSTGINRPLDRTYRTLAEVLAARGYATGGFVANATYCGAETGLDRGFEHYEDHPLSVVDVVWTTAIGQRLLLQGPLQPERRARGNPNDYHRKDASQVRRRVIDWVGHQGDRPFFAFVNLYDAHDPYLPPSDCTRRFTTGPGSVEEVKVLERWFISDKNTLSPEQIQFTLDSYDEGIAYLDDQVGRLLDDLERAGKGDDTLVIITADHGEHLGEHGLYGHASSLYDSEIHVPLLVLLPKGSHAGRTVAGQVSLRDLAATVADVTGLGTGTFPGSSLTRHWRSSGTPDDVPSLSEVDAPVMGAPNQGRSPVFRGPMQAVATGDYVYIHNGDGKEQLFEIRSDSGQSRDLATAPEARSVLEELRTAFHLLKPDLHQVGTRADHLAVRQESDGAGRTDHASPKRGG
jgi:arylsulfatase A-like enzyme